MADVHLLANGAEQAAAEAAGRAYSRLFAISAFIALLALYFISYFQRVAVPGTIFDELQGELGSASAVVALGALFTIVYGGMQLFVGILADRFGGSRLALVGGFFLAAGSMLFPFAVVDWQFYAARLFTGFGASFIFLCLIKEIDRLFAPRLFTILLGVVLLVGYTGGVFGTWPLTRAAVAWGWRCALLASGIFAALALTLAFPILRRLGPPQKRESLSLKPIIEVLRNRAVWPLLAGSLLYFPIFFCVQSIFGKKFLQDVAGLAPATAAMFVLAMTGVSAFAGMLGGVLPNWLGSRRRPCLIAAASLITIAIAIILIGIAIQAPVAVYGIAYFLLALGLLGNPATAAVIKEMNRQGIAAASVAVANSLAYVGCSLLGHAGGIILDACRQQAQTVAGTVVYPASAYFSLFAFFLLAALINLACFCFVPETHGRHLSVGM